MIRFVAFWAAVAISFTGSVGCFGYAAMQGGHGSAGASSALRSPISFERTAR